MTIRKLMLSTAILAAMSGGVMAQTATDTADPAATEGGVTDMASGMENAPQSLEEMTVGDVLGTPVISGDGDSVGEIDYVINMSDGTPGAVIGIGGFLGLGEYTVALPLDAFTYDPEQNALTVGMTEDELEATPEFDESGVESLPDETRISELMQSDSAPAASSEDNASDMNADASGAAGGAASTDTEATIEGAETEVGEAAEETSDSATETASDTGNAVENTAESAGAAAGAAANDTEQAAENAAEDVENATENAANEIENAADEAGQEMAEAANEAENAAENAGDEVAQAAEDAENSAENAGEDMAQSSDEGGQGIAEPANESQSASAGAPSSLEQMSVAEATGTTVQNDAGEDIGEIEYVVMQNDKSIDAVIGVGGFLGVGERSVALPLSDLTYDEEQKVLKVTMTEEEIRQAPEYDEASSDGAQKLSKDTIIGEAQQQ